MADATRLHHHSNMDLIFCEMIGLVGWVTEKYGSWAGWVAALLAIALLAVAVWIGVALASR